MQMPKTTGSIKQCKRSDSAAFCVSLRQWSNDKVASVAVHIKHGFIESELNQRLAWWVRYQQWNDELHPIVKKRTCLIHTYDKLLSMRNFRADQPIVEDQPDDSYAAWLERKRLDDEEPWLFYGEDEAFITAAWIPLYCRKSSLIPIGKGSVIRT